MEGFNTFFNSRVISYESGVLTPLFFFFTLRNLHNTPDKETNIATFAAV